MNNLMLHLPRLLLQLLLLPLVLFWVPLMFAMAWVHEAFEDLLQPPRLRPARALLQPRGALRGSVQTRPIR